MDRKMQIELYNDFMRAYKTAMKEHGFKSQPFLRMLDDHGPYETAKKLTNQLKWQSGYEKLAFLGRTDLTVEHIILQGKYRKYFTNKQIYNAEEKIRQAKLIKGHIY